MKVTIHCTGHRISQKICSAFQYGTKFPMVERDFEPKPDAVFQYGVLRKNNKLRDRCFKQGVDNFLCDNGYFLPGHFDGYYRITKNRFQSDGFGEPKWDRYERLGLEVKPWRKTGDFILITVPPPEYNKYWNFDGDAWVRKIKSKLKQATKRKYKFTYKPVLDYRCPPSQPPLDAFLDEAWAVVTYNSGVALDALQAGVPVFCTGDSPARRLGNVDLSVIDEPFYNPSREKLFAILAGQQWTLEEMRLGIAWRDLMTQYS